MKERPKIVVEIAQVLLINVGAFIVGMIVVLPGAWFLPDLFYRILAVVLELVCLTMAILYAVLAYGFYHLEPWAYGPTKYLVRIDRLSWLAGLRGKIEQPEVSKAFGISDDAGSHTEARQ